MGSVVLCIVYVLVVYVLWAHSPRGAQGIASLRRRSGLEICGPGQSWEMHERVPFFWGGSQSPGQANCTGKLHPESLWRSICVSSLSLSSVATLFCKTFRKKRHVPFSPRAFESHRSRPGDNCTAHCSAGKCQLLIKASPESGPLIRANAAILYGFWLTSE